MSGKAPVPFLRRRATLTEQHVSPKPGIAKTPGLTIKRNADQTTAKRRETKSTKQQEISHQYARLVACPRLVTSRKYVRAISPIVAAYT